MSSPEAIRADKINALVFMGHFSPGADCTLAWISLKLYAISGICLSLAGGDSKAGLDDQWLMEISMRKSGQVMIIIGTPTMTR